MRIDLVGIDADDTLWHNQPNYDFTQRRFCELVGRHVPGVAADSRLLEVERRNMHRFGYGIKAFTLSMIETAIDLTDGRIPAEDIAAIIAHGKAMYDRPIELIDHAAEVVAQLTASYPVVVITKGDLLDQESKLARSGLAELTERIEVVGEKDVASYRRVLDRYSVAAEHFVMIGDSLRSDVIPVLALGGSAVHVPYATPWAHEVQGVGDVRSERCVRVATLLQVPAALEALSHAVAVA